MKKCPTCEAAYPNRFSVCPQDGAKLVESSGWSEGTVVRGKYRILSKVGQGGMGAVYKVSHTTFDELRALKVMNPDLLGDELFVKRFKQEAIIARKLDHPNAVRVDDLDESEDGLPFMVMEYIEGQSLKSLIEQYGPLPAGRACSIAKQVAAALDSAHRLGMVHRDIKPANIVLIQTPRGEQAKVLDFGIAKLREARASDSGMTLTGTGMVMGTPQYMSPEQALGKRGDQLDGRSDLYSLGVVMYQMLAGELPFKADTTMQLLLAHINTPPRPLLEVKPGLNIPPALAGVVMKCLEKDPNRRSATGAALIDELDAAESGWIGAAATESEPGADMATMIAAPGVGREALPSPRTAPTASARISAESIAVATQTPPGIEQPQPVLAVPPEPKHGLRWMLIAAAVIVVLAVAGGAVWFVRFRPQPLSVPVAVRTTRPATAPAATTTSAEAKPSGSTFPSPGGGSTSTNPVSPLASNATNAAVTATSTEPPPTSENKKAARAATAETAPLKAQKRPPKREPPAATQVTSAEQSGAQPTPANTPREVAAASPPAAPPVNPSLATAIVTTSPGAKIYIDGKAAGTVDSSGKLTVNNLNPGTHTLRGSLEGFQDVESGFRVPPGGVAFLNPSWGASQTMASVARPAQPQSSPHNAASQGVAASYPVDYLRHFGSSKGLLVIEGSAIRYKPADGKDAFSSSLAGISWGSNGGDSFYIRLANGGRTYKFRSGSSATILATLQRAVSAPSIQ